MMKLKMFLSQSAGMLETKFNEWNKDYTILTSYILKDPETGLWVLSIFYEDKEVKDDLRSH